MSSFAYYMSVSEASKFGINLDKPITILGSKRECFTNENMKRCTQVARDCIAAKNYKRAIDAMYPLEIVKMQTEDVQLRIREIFDRVELEYDKAIEGMQQLALKGLTIIYD